MFTVAQTEAFEDWLASLKDVRARAKIFTRIDRLINGNPGDVKAVGNGVSEMRIDHGQGYRVYYKQTGKELVLLLCGGDKSSQSRDIERAKALAEG